MKDLKKKLNAFMQVCYHLMVGNQPKTQEEAYVCICDTLVMFRYLMHHSKQYLVCISDLLVVVYFLK